MRIQHFLLTELVCVAMLAAFSNHATAQDYVAWAWSANLPTNVSVTITPTNRTTTAVTKLFKERSENTKPPQMAAVLAGLGRPEAFSPQFVYSRKQGTAKPSLKGGTFRFVISGGGEVHVWTADFASVGLAILYDSKGQGELLYK